MVVRAKIFSGEIKGIEKELGEWLEKGGFKKIWHISSCGLSEYGSIAITVIYE
jgi:hypothetical protein